jgi:type II secretory pathway component PulF
VSAVFAYIALNKEGRRTSGTLSADSRAAALAEVTRLGLHPVSIDQAKDAAAAAKKVAAASTGPRTIKVSQRAVENFTRELANLLAGGVSLARALALLRREAHNPSAKQLWSEVHDDVVGGTSLGDALAKWPRTFSSVYVAMVRAGEAGGFLDVVLTQIADFRTREADLMGKVKAAMIYPVVLALLAVAVLIFLMEFFIPRFSGIFSNFGASLPALTLFVIHISNIVKHYGIYVAGVLIVLFIVFKRAIATDTGKRKLEVVILSVPLLGTVTASFALVRFTRMLGTLVGAGVPLVASLKVAREAIGNQTLADTVLHATEEVQRGEPLSKSLIGNNKLFPSSVIEMIAVAEETGKLDKELLRIATTYEADLDRQLRMLVAVGEPVMLFIMAGVIGTVVVSMLLPILNLQDVVH